MVVVSDEAASIAFRRRTDRRGERVVKAGLSNRFIADNLFIVNDELCEVRYE